MDIHTDLIRSGDLYEAALAAGVFIESARLSGSRSRDHKWSVYLSGSSNRMSNGRDHNAATWDEWGAFLHRLYLIDDTAKVGRVYDNFADFRRKTGNRFDNGMPADTHNQHKWVYDYERSSPFGDRVLTCNSCSAHTVS